MRPIKILLVFLLLFSIDACKRNEKLTLLTHDEVIVKITNKELYFDKKIVYRDSNYNILKKSNFKTVDTSYLGKDFFVDDQEMVKEIRFRPLNFRDRILKIHRRAKKYYDPSKDFSIIDIDSTKIDSILADVYKTDQEVRNTGSTEEIRSTDKKNRIFVVSILHKYGFPKQENLKGNSIWAIFLTIQHASPELRAYYYGDLLCSAIHGDLPLQAIALLEDRILRDYGYDQVYGTQRSSIGDLPIEDSTKVNERRKERGLDPLF